MENTFKTNYLKPLPIAMFILPFLFGLFHEFIACFVSAIFLIYILVETIRQKSITLSYGTSFLAVAVIVAGYLLSAFWAIDKGMAFFGFFKFLPALLWSVIILPKSSEEKKVLLSVIPWSGAIMTVLSYLLSFFAVFDGYFSVADRLAGFFGYPNTFALFLLIGFIILATSEKLNVYSLILGLVLLFGIFQSGSRTVFVLLVVTAVLIVIFRNDKKIRLAILIGLPCLVVFSILFVIFTGNIQTVGRFLTSSLSSSTFLGRLLYFQDVLPVILQTPFGLGYDGYQFAQSAFQTGVYSTRYVHNDFLQLLIDIGWLPTLLLVAAIVKSFFHKGKSLQHRLIIAVICAHCMFDFSLQFTVIFMILVQVLEYDHSKKLTLSSSAKGAAAISLSCVAMVSLYFGSAACAYYFGAYQTAASLYPAYTEAQIRLMLAEKDLEKSHEYSDKVLSLNQSVAQAYDIQAMYDYSKGDFAGVIENKERSLSLSPYTLTSYTDYLDMLGIGIQLYQQAGDGQSLQYCAQQAAQIPNRLQAVKEKTSPLAWKIADKPQLELPEGYEELLQFCEALSD